MNKGNPYKELGKSDIFALIRGMPFTPTTETGWVATIRRILKAQAGQSYAAGHASRDEVVNELVGALGETLAFIDAIADQLPNPVRGERRLVDHLSAIKQAIAKAKP